MLEKESCSSRLKKALLMRNMRQSELCELTKIPKSAMSQYINGAFEPKQDRIYAMAKALNVSEAWLMGFNVEMYPEKQFEQPTITEDTVQIPIIGEIAAGYDKIAIEEWSTEQVEIPTSFLNGRERNEYFFLIVKGDSMYPDYKDGDKVLILRQPTLDYSGQVGAIIYEDCATLKRIEFVPGEDWLRMVPINPQFPPKRVEGVDLEHCCVIGVPKMLIREL